MAPKKKIKRKAVKKKTVKKAVKRKIVKKKLTKKAPRAKNIAAKRKIKENIIGIVTHYFPHVQAAVIKLKAPLSIGETIKIKGHTTDLTQTITSMQIDRVPITSAKKGEEIGLLVNTRVRQHDRVTKV